MDTIFLEMMKISPILGFMMGLWFYQRKDYKELVDRVSNENAKREENYQSTINKLTDKFNILEGVSTDIKELKGVKEDIKELKDDVEDIKDKIK